MSSSLLDKKLAKVWGNIYDGKEEKRGGLLIGGMRGGVMVQGGVLLGGRRRKAAPKRKRVAVRSKTTAAKSNPWIKHVKAYAKKYGIGYGDALKKARASYRCKR
jgi:hypothetical protein